MNAEHTEAILRDFPELFKPPSFDLRSGLMAFGFECGDGWFGLVYGLCRDLMPLYRELTPEAQESFYVTQIKEKWGTLSFYTSTIPLRPGEETVSRPAGEFAQPGDCGAIDGLISAAETASGTICEECGAPGTLRQGGWWRTLCDAHEAERAARR